MFNFKPYLLFFALLLGVVPLFAQRVAVVFSGGGAKGLVHLGALKALEENEIPIDAIAGTSIGAIVGGMYAAGYTVDEVVAYMLSDEFKQWSTGDFSSEGQYYYKQGDADAEMFSIRVNINREKSHFVLPTNLVPPYQMDFAFMQLFAGANAAAHGSLDSLMVPFRALSYDAYNKRAYAPARGDLGTLIRASMSFPGIFKPAVVDSLLLFDGGMVNDFPVNVAEKEFSPDFIIGVKCSDNYERPTEDDVFSYVTSLMSRRTEYHIKAGRGVLIDMDSLDNVALLDFAKVKELIAFGYRKTMEQMPYIKSRIQRKVTAENMFLKRHAFRRNLPNLRFKNAEVNGVHEGLKTYITEEMQSPQNETFSLRQIKSRYFGVVSDGGVSTFYPTATYSKADSAYRLSIRASETPNVKLAVGGVLSNYSNLGFFGAEYQRFSTHKFRVGANFYFGSVYNSQKIYQRLDTRIKRWRVPVFMDMNVTHNSFDYYSNNPDMVFSDTRPDFLQDDEVFGGLGVGTYFLLNRSLRLDGTVGSRNVNYYNRTDFTSEDVPEKMSYHFVSGGISINKNTLNDKHFPTMGMRESLSVTYTRGNEFHTQGTTAVDFDSAKFGKRVFVGSHGLFMLKYLREGHLMDFKYFTLRYHVESVWSAGHMWFRDDYSAMLMLPSFEPLPNLQGFFLQNFRANVYAAVGLMPIFIFSDRFYLRTEAYAFQPFTFSPTVRTSDGKGVFNEAIQHRFTVMGAATLVLKTPVGPLATSLSYYDKKGENIYFSISFGYNIYNKRAFNN